MPARASRGPEQNYRKPEEFHIEEVMESGKAEDDKEGNPVVGRPCSFWGWR
jgi:hypothetical protein